MAKKEKVPVSKRALLARINRAIAKDDLTLRCCRPDSRWYHDLGDYYVVETRLNAMIHKNVDLEAYGAELGVLKPFEKLTDS